MGPDKEMVEPGSDDGAEERRHHGHPEEVVVVPAKGTVARRRDSREDFRAVDEGGEDSGAEVARGVQWVAQVHAVGAAYEHEDEAEEELWICIERRSLTGWMAGGISLRLSMMTATKRARRPTPAT